MRIVQVGIGVFPLIALALVYSTSIAVRIALGQWPVYGHPDPSLLPHSIRWLEVSATFAFLAAWASPALSIPMIAGSLHPRLRAARLPAGLLIGSWGILGLAFWIDPGGQIDWLLD